MSCACSRFVDSARQDSLGTARICLSNWGSNSCRIILERPWRGNSARRPALISERRGHSRPGIWKQCGLGAIGTLDRCDMHRDAVGRACHPRTRISIVLARFKLHGMPNLTLTGPINPRRVQQVGRVRRALPSIPSTQQHRRHLPTNCRGTKSGSGGIRVAARMT